MSKNADGAPETSGSASALPSVWTSNRREDATAPVSMWSALLKTLRHFYPDLRAWLQTLPDPRDPRFITYPMAHVLTVGLFLFLTKLGSRRQIRFQFKTDAFQRNLNYLCQTDLETMAHPDTLGYLLKKLDGSVLSDLRRDMIHRLIRMRCLEADRLLGRWYLVAIDASGHLAYGSKRHCAHCLTRKHADQVFYYHMVLEAKLVTPRGLSLSLATEFVENAHPNASKQDCELAAFRRLVEAIKRDYPQLPMCLLMDGLYACEPVFDLCRDNRWKFVITFKEGSASAVFAEYERLKTAGAKSHSQTLGAAEQTFWWVNDIPFGKHPVHVLECREAVPQQEPRRFVWVTNIAVTETNGSEIANRGGRVRWKIENQGFNIQKTNGYEMEHAYSENENAAKGFYLLLQIAHLIAQLMEKGLLARNLPKTIGAIKNIARWLLEELRHVDPDVPRLNAQLARRIQVRFQDSS